MAMTKVEKASKAWLIKKLSREGYPTYARIFQDFDLNLTEDPTVVGFMDPRTGNITVNKGLDEDQVSVIIRHEILHNFLKHEKRLLNHLAEKTGLDPNALDDMNLKELRSALYSDDTFNIAADYEISNRGYTESDKRVARAIKLNGQLLTGLVTEDKHPDWVDLSVEQMYDKLKDDPERNTINGMLIDPTTFVDPMTGVTYGI